MIVRRAAIAILLALLAAISPIVPAQSKPAAESRPAAPESQPAGDPAVYAPLMRFVPEKIESLMLVSRAGLPEKLEELVLAGLETQKEQVIKAVRAVSAGRKFNDRFDYEGVVVHELEKPLSLGDVLREDRFSYETIAGVPCFVAKPPENDYEWGPVETWLAVVEKKYLISATRRTILKEVLAAKGASAEVRVEKLGWKPDAINWASPVLIVKKQEPNRAEATRLIDRLLYTYEPAKKKGRLQVYSKDGAATLQSLRRLLSDQRADSRPENEDESFSFGTVDHVSTAGDLHVFTVGLADEDKHEWALSRGIDMIYRGIHFY